VAALTACIDYVAERLALAPRAKRTTAPMITTSTSSASTVGSSHRGTLFT
jgi:hypothetical protein